MGLLISVYRGQHDCTNGGVSSTHHTLCAVNLNGPFEPSVDVAPPVMLDMHYEGCLRFVPAIRVNGEWVRAQGTMFGGNYGASSDSRFTEACENLLGHAFYGAVKIHDRTE